MNCKTVSFMNEKIRFAGYYGLITCCEDLSDEEILLETKRIKGGDRESSFRVKKSVLCTRPIYVRTEAHIRGHFVVFVFWHWLWSVHGIWAARAGKK